MVWTRFKFYMETKHAIAGIVHGTNQLMVNLNFYKSVIFI